jgi:ubiquinol-cytochrome c reductase cytochrome c subunit
LSSSVRSSRRRRRATGYLVLLGALVAVGFGYAALAPGSSASGPSSGPTAAVIKGRELFLLNCASCHGYDATGTGVAPSLIGVGSAMVDFQLSTGRMPLAEHGPEAPERKPAFDRKQILQIAAYIASLAPGPAIPSSLDWKSANFSAGGALFRTNCAQCHNSAGAGGALTYGKYAPALNSVTPLEIYEAMETGPENMPDFNWLTAQQKLDIIRYVRGVQTESDPGGLGLGRVGPVTEGLVGWLAGAGLCVLIAMWIGSKA